MHVATTLFGEPFVQMALNFSLAESTIHACVFQSSTNFLENIEMVLDILKAAVFGELVKEGFDLLLGGGHVGARIARTSAAEAAA